MDSVCMLKATLQCAFRFSLCALILFVGGAPVLAREKQQYVEGVHFQRVAIPQLTRYPGKVEVTEFFRYSCPHCQNFHPLVKAWVKNLKDDVVFNMVPYVFEGKRAGRVEIQAYYSTLAFDREDIHDVIFERSGSPKYRDQPTTLAKMARLFDEHGVPNASFRKAIESFGIIASIARAQTLAKNYNIQAVPCLIVQGKYKILPNRYVSLAAMLQVADYLIELERRALKRPEEKLQDGGA